MDKIIVFIKKYMKSYFRYVDILLYTYNFIQRLAEVMVISSNKINKNI